MSTITHPEESQETTPARRPLGHLQAKIDAPLLDRVRVLAARRRCPPRDIVAAALEGYLPKAEREAEKLQGAGKRES